MPLLPFAGKPFKFKTAPSGPSDTCTAGDLAYDGSYLYVCTANNYWERAAIATWVPVTPGAGYSMGLLLSLTYSA